MLRLRNQQIGASASRSPAALTSWMCALQAQEFEQAKWAIGSRIASSVEADIQRSISKGSVIRTWLFRGTLHFVNAHDAHWLLELLRPRLIPKTRARNKELSLSESFLTACNSLLAECLGINKEMSRKELELYFKQRKIDAKGPRLSHILWRAAVDQVICCGARNDAFRLLKPQDPQKQMSKEEALAEIARRYFLSRGPATIEDFAGWSGLTLTESRTGIEQAGGSLHQFTAGNISYWISSGRATSKISPPSYCLLAGFDEFYMSYKDKNIFTETKHIQHIVQRNGIFNPIIVIDGQIEGIWKRTFHKEKVIVEIQAFKKFNSRQKAAVAEAASLFSHYAGKELQLNF